ncbi:MAG: nucleotidyltransferase family protein [Halioglobus sp.]
MQFSREIALLKLLADDNRQLMASRVLARELDFQQLLDFLERHELSQYFAHKLDALQLGKLFPAGFRERLRWQGEAQAQQRTALASALRELHSVFAAAGVEIVLTKGLYLADQYWGGVANRFTWDIDVLVKARDVDRAVQSLQQCGYRSVHTRPFAAALVRRFSHAMEFTRLGTAVDLHWIFRPRPGHRVDYNAVWERCGYWQFDGLQYRVLSPQDTLLMLLLGIAQDVERAQPNYRKLWDIYLLLGSEVVADWDAFFHLAGQQGVDRLAIAMLSFTCHALDCQSAFPALDRALQQHSGRTHCSAQQLQKLLERPPKHPANRLFIAGLQPVSAAYYLAWWTLTAPMRYLVWR